MPIPKAFLDDFPREIRDEIYNVPIKQGQSPDALYHDTCFAMRGDCRSFHVGTDERFHDLCYVDSKYPRIARQIDEEFTDCMSRFVPLQLQGFLERIGGEYQFEEDSLDTILPHERALSDEHPMLRAEEASEGPLPLGLGHTSSSGAQRRTYQMNHSWLCA